MGSDVERVKAFHQIESYLDDETKELLIDKLNLKDANLQKRLPGLKVEDEFALILFFLNNCKHIVSLDETTAVLTQDSYQSDFIIHFLNDKKIMVEVKSSEDSKFKISNNNLKKKKQFANDLGYELYFALRLKGFWTLYHADYISTNGNKIDLSRDINKSIFYTELNCSLYAVPESIRIESLYSNDLQNGLGVQHEDFGELINYKLFYQNRLIFEVSSSNKDYFHMCLFLELWHDSLASEMIVERLDINTIKLIDETKKELLTLDFRYFLSSISHTINDYSNNRYESSSFLKLLASKENIGMSKKMLEHALSELVVLGIPIKFNKFITSDEVTEDQYNE